MKACLWRWGILGEEPFGKRAIKSTFIDKLILIYFRHPQHYLFGIWLQLRSAVCNIYNSKMYCHQDGI